MRVIAGRARRLQLKTIEGPDTRPTTDRIKETLFNILNPDLADTRFLDLFAGSGGIGIEALSRGARQAVFIEQNPKAAGCIRENLTVTHFESEGTVMNCDVFTGLKRLEDQGEVFDLIFMDPPYDKDLERQVMEYLSGSRIIGSETVIIIEALLTTSFDYLEDLGFSLKRSKEYKTNKHVFAVKGE